MSRRFGFQVVLASALVLAACSEEKKPQQPPPPDPPEAHVKIADPTSGPYPIGQRIVVDGRESKGEGELEYRWTLHVPEGSQAEFEFENRDRNAFTPDTGGTYVVELVVVDKNGESEPATLEIAVAYGAPVAVLELHAPDPVVALEDEVVADGSKSHDPVGRPLTYEFRLTARPPGSNAQLVVEGAEARFIPDRGGTYQVGLRVKNETTWSEEVVQSIQVQPPRNLAPVANAGPDFTVEVGRVAQLDGSQSSDPNGDPLTYEWNFLETPEGSTASIEDADKAKARFIPDLEGTYVVELRVFDGELDSTDTVVVTARPFVNAPPQIVRVRLDGVPVDPGVFVTRPFGQAAVVEVEVQDEVPSSVQLRWQLDPPAGSTAELVPTERLKAEFVPDVEGFYELTVVAHDGDLDSDPFSFGVRFRDPASNLPPLAVLEVLLDVPGGMLRDDGVYSFENGTTITLDGSKSVDQDNPPDDLITYTWLLEAKPTGEPQTLNKAGPEPTTTFRLDYKTVERHYRFRLVVKDRFGAESAPAIVEVEARNRPPVARTNKPAPARLSQVHLDRLGQGLSSAVVLNAFPPANETSDPDPGDNANLTVEWEIVAAPEGSNPVLFDRFAESTGFYTDTAGSYQVELTACDNDPIDNLCDTATVEITITD